MNDRLNRKDGYLGRYTIMFICAAMMVLLPFVLMGKSLVMGYDGPYQHYSALLYLGNYVRGGLSGEGWKMVDLSLGQGLDVIATLGYYCFFEPMALLTAWVPAAYTEIAYTAVLFARMYLAGLFACLLAREYRAEGWACSIGGLMYAFCGFAAIGVMKHLNFGIGHVFLPLLLLSIERYLKRGSWVGYVVTVALMLISNYYFAFMNTVIAVIYIVISLIVRIRENPVKQCANQGFVLLGGFLLGAAISAVVFLPSAAAFLSNGRVGDESGYSGSMLHYGVAYYAKWILCFFQTARFMAHWGASGFIPVAAFALVALFIGRKQGAGRIRAMLAIFIIMLCVPFAGKVMNGFGYVSNRWCYALALFVGLATAIVLPGLWDDARKWKKWVAILGILWSFAGIAVLRNIPSVFVLAAFALTIWLICPELLKAKLRLNPEKRIPVTSVLATIFAAMYAVMFFAPFGDNVIDDFVDAGIYARDVRDETTYFESLPDADFYRVAQSMDKGGGIDYQDNYAHAAGYNGTSFYWSLIPSTVSSHYIDLYANNLVKSYHLMGLGGGADLNLLSSVKYMIRPEEAEDVMPFGYEQTDAFTGNDGKNYIIYENTYALPLGYVFDEAMCVEEYRTLNPVQKRDALLEKAVIMKESAAVPDFEYEGMAGEAEIRLEGFEGEDVLAFGAGSKVYCEVTEQSEVYVVFENVACDMRLGDESASEKFYLQGARGANHAAVVKATKNYAYPQKGASLYMGVFEPGEWEFTVNAGEKKGYFADKVKVYCRPVAEYTAAAETLGETVMENIEIGTNCISGTVSMENPGYLQISVPWNAGWSAKVDGEAAELLLCGGMYMGLELEAGEHKIELGYETPYIKEGFIISAAGLIAFLLIFYIEKRRKARR